MGQPVRRARGAGGGCGRARIRYMSCVTLTAHTVTDTGERSPRYRGDSTVSTQQTLLRYTVGIPTLTGRVLDFSSASGFCSTIGRS